ncbi:MAG: DegT/DnrJ/EryC1/StrS family aminotransferase [Candidatus Magasanikbacteria bacterium]|nr:DegT/DnrJ/EryC1/StrS family aminotransferase [Candidatus Magasanikbacteria bacterium]
MSDNITREDVNTLISFLQQDPIPQFTNGPKVKQFEDEWGKWLGTKNNIMVGSGSMANELSLLALKFLHPDGGEILVSPLGWVSDFAAILHAGFTPVFCDINLKNLSINVHDVRRKITSKTKALLLVHILGYNGLSDDVINICQTHNITLIEDCCESHGATFKGQKVGTFGSISNFSFFYAHHLCSLAEGGMICTNDENLFNLFRCFRSHGMVRECPDQRFKDLILKQNPELNPDFIFLEASHNGRSQEVNAVVALNQLKSLDANNAIRSDNLLYFWIRITLYVRIIYYIF